VLVAASVLVPLAAGPGSTEDLLQDERSARALAGAQISRDRGTAGPGSDLNGGIGPSHNLAPRTLFLLRYFLGRARSTAPVIQFHGPGPLCDRLKIEKL
jgi:hypothetical protein